METDVEEAWWVETRRRSVELRVARSRKFSGEGVKKSALCASITILFHLLPNAN
jgi:hypothetical protein